MKCFSNWAIGVALAVSLLSLGLLVPAPVSADITCYDFDSQAEAQAVYDALPGDPFGIDTGWPTPGVLGGGDQEAGNGIPCDAIKKLPENESPGDEPYKVYTDSSRNGLTKLPKGNLEEAHIQSVQYAEAIQTVENPEKLYRIIGIATPEFESLADYEGHEVPGQCGSFETTSRLQELLAPGTTVWLEIDEAGFGGATVLARHIWIQLEGKYRLLSEVLVTEGHAVVATERPGTALVNAGDKDLPDTTRYRDALRKAQKLAIKGHRGMWGQCAA